uniref:Cartilage acidic protein 2 n=1 Tax=Physcomitrium patens TaxID=3218 RepID=A1XF86_PHYPA|nr:cartilage acidic protein 2 [Physcomitrium patens]
MALSSTLLRSWTFATAALGISRSIRPSWRGGAARLVCSSEGMQSVSTESGGQQAVKQAMFKDASHLIAVNPPRLNYGVCVSDLDGDGEFELFVCGFGFQNQVLKWNGNELVDIAVGTPLEDPETKSIGVAAADFDADGREELYVLNTDTFLGRKKVTDRLFDSQSEQWVDLFSLPRNMDESNMCAGRSVCAVDRLGNGKYSFFVANYGGLMNMFEMTEEGFVADVASEVGLATYPTGGRTLVSLPLISHSSMGIFAGHQGGPNFLFINKGDDSGRFVECASAYGLMDALENCRGVAVVDAMGDGQLGLACGNWQGSHRLFSVSGPGPIGGAKALGFKDGDVGGFKDVAPPAMARPSAIRTVIAADFDNDGYEELFFNNIGDANRLFRQSGAGNWVECDIGDASEPKGLGTGAAVADFDGDGRLELLISHGELRAQPLSLYRSPENDNAWMRVKPLTKQGAPARGATVRLVDESGRVQKRAIDAGSGYLCCMEPVAHFGLGSLAGPVNLQIVWPDGAEVTMANVSTRQLVTVFHP